MSTKKKVSFQVDSDNDLSDTSLIDLDDDSDSNSDDEDDDSSLSETIDHK